MLKLSRAHVIGFRVPCAYWYASQEWDDVRLQAARQGVQDRIAHGVHKYLVLNVDQLWRQSLRFNKEVIMQGKQRQLDVHRTFYVPTLFFSHRCLICFFIAKGWSPELRCQATRPPDIPEWFCSRSQEVYHGSNKYLEFRRSRTIGIVCARWICQTGSYGPMECKARRSCFYVPKPKYVALHVQWDVAGASPRPDRASIGTPKKETWSSQLHTCAPPCRWLDGIPFA